MKLFSLKKSALFSFLSVFLTLFLVPALALAAVIPNDPDFNRQWYLGQIQVLEAWELTTGSPEVVVAVLDTGVDIDQPDLAANIWTNPREVENGLDDDRNGYLDDLHGWNFVENTSDPSPKVTALSQGNGVHHGTIVSGVLAASGNNGIGIAGVAWNVKIMPLRVLGNDGTGNTAAVIRGIDYAVGNGAQIINMSFVGLDYSANLERAIERAHHAGVVIVAAAGNDRSGNSGFSLDETPTYPVCHDGPKGENWIIGVAALDTLDQKIGFSNYGKCIDIAAPGVGVWSTAIYKPQVVGFDAPYRGLWSGTSVAAPQVAGAVALMKSLFPKLSPDDALRLIRDNGSAIDGVNLPYIKKLGGGRLNIRATLEALVRERENLGQAHTPSRLLLSPAKNYPADVKLVEEDGKVVKSVIAFPPAWKGGVSAAAGDFDGDGQEEIVVAAGAGGGPQVRIFTALGRLVGSFFAFDRLLRGGVEIATADLDGDGKDEIIAAPGPGSTPHVRIFRSDGQLLGGFLAFDPRFRGGVHLATGDVDGDGQAEIVVGAGAGGGPQVRIFNDQGKRLFEFLAYDPTNRGGIFVATADTDADGQAEIVVGSGAGNLPLVRVFTPIGALRTQISAYPPNMRAGVRVSGIK